MLCENIFFDGSGTIYIIEPNKNDIAIDKFCSCESMTPLEGQFAYFNGDINSTILQGSIVNGGNSSVSNGMISITLDPNPFQKQTFPIVFQEDAQHFNYY